MIKKKLLLLIIPVFLGCQKKLELKPNSTVVLPKTIKDLENLLANTSIHNTSPALAQLSADEYFITGREAWQSLPNVTAKNAVIWQKDIYEGQQNVYAWDIPYSAIFYCNNVLDLLAGQDISNDEERKRIKGWALFARAYNFYDLVSTYAKAYDPATAQTDLGISLKLHANIDETVPRSTLQQSYDHITDDLKAAASLLQQNIIPGLRNRPSKVAAYALLARVYLSMRQYSLAEQYTDRSLALYSKLTDFNTLDQDAAAGSFNYDSEEIIYFTRLTIEGIELTGAMQSNSYGIDSTLLALYDPSDLRLNIYFQKNSLENYNAKPINILGSIPSSGLATDEMYLIKAECLARRAQKEEAIATLNLLLKTRMRKGSFIPLTAAETTNPLDQVLTERRKALVWRSLRWTDLKRLNLEGRNITLTRKLDGHIYTLEPNSSRYVLPIPDYEIALSGVTQNIR